MVEPAMRCQRTFQKIGTVLRLQSGDVEDKDLLGLQQNTADGKELIWIGNHHTQYHGSNGCACGFPQQLLTELAYGFLLGKLGQIQ